MKFLKSFIVLMLAFSMVFTLCACGGNEDDAAETTNKVEETTVIKEETTVVADDKVTYEVTVVDEENKPVVGAMVQLCLDACIPALTNNHGIAIFNVVEEEYKVSFVKMPEGYTSDVEEFYFEDGSHEMTITLKTAE